MATKTLPRAFAATELVVIIGQTFNGVWQSKPMAYAEAQAEIARLAKQYPYTNFWCREI